MPSERGRPTSPFNVDSFLLGGNSGAPAASNDYGLPSFAVNETKRGGEAKPAEKDGEEAGFMQRSNTQFNMRVPGYDPLPLDD